MVSTSKTIAVFRTTMRAIFGRRKKDANHTPLTSSSSSTMGPATTSNFTTDRFPSLQPNCELKTTNCEIDHEAAKTYAKSVVRLKCQFNQSTTQEGENGEGRCTTSATTEVSNGYTRSIRITSTLLDVMAFGTDSDSTPLFTSQMELTLNALWTEYVLIYSRLGYGLSILAQLLDEVTPYINFFQVIGDNQGLVIHFRDAKYQYWFLQLISRVFGIQLVLTSPEWFYTLSNYEIINAFKEYNLQLIKYRKLYLINIQRQVILVYGIPLFIPKKLLIDEFRKFGELISFSFAPTGPLTRFHVIKLQYSKKDDRANISKEIKKIVSNLKFKVVLKVRIKSSSKA